MADNKLKYVAHPTISQHMLRDTTVVNTKQQKKKCCSCCNCCRRSRKSSQTNKNNKDKNNDETASVDSDTVFIFWWCFFDSDNSLCGNCCDDCTCCSECSCCENCDECCKDCNCDCDFDFDD